jgi:hypothetical protein
MAKNPLSLQIDPSMFEPASNEEKQQLSIQRESLSYWKDAWKRLRKNPTAMIGLAHGRMCGRFPARITASVNSAPSARQIARL